METKTEKLPVTTKKQVFVGMKELVDTETGEIIPVQLKQVEDRDFNFHKIWLQMFINGLDGIANKKMKLAFWIIDNLELQSGVYVVNPEILYKGGHYGRMGVIYQFNEISTKKQDET